MLHSIVLLRHLESLKKKKATPGPHSSEAANWSKVESRQVYFLERPR